MKKTGLVLSMLVIISLCSYAHAITISVPTLYDNDSEMIETGLVFMVLEDVTLTSFVYINQGAADTILLADSEGSILYTYETPMLDKSHTIDVSWELSQGETYNLVAQQPEIGGNGSWLDLYDMRLGNEHINFLPSGYNLLQSDPTYMQRYWFNFTDIVTEEVGKTQPIPEPATVTLISIGIIGLACGAIKRKWKRKIFNRS